MIGETNDDEEGTARTQPPETGILDDQSGDTGEGVEENLQPEAIQPQVQ